MEVEKATTKKRRPKKRNPLPPPPPPPAIVHDEDDDCQICGCALENNAHGHPLEPVALTCNKDLIHVFHRRCIDAWFKGKLPINSTCPICRKDPREEHNIRVAKTDALIRMRRHKNRTIIDKFMEGWFELRSSLEDVQRAFRPYFMPIAAVSSAIILVIIFFLLTSSFGRNQSKTLQPPPFVIHPVKQDNVPSVINLQKQRE